jgi:hypothetical protein
MSEQEHSPLPWEHVPSNEHHGAYICNGYGADVCDLYAMSDPSQPSTRNGGISRPIPFTDADANAAFIVEACNSYHDLRYDLSRQLEIAAELATKNAELAARVKVLEGALKAAREFVWNGGSTLNALALIDSALAKKEG